MNEPREKSPTEKVKASRKRFVALLMIAFVPILIAYGAFFHFPGWAPAGTTNQGELIAPPIDGRTMSEQLGTFSKWVLIQPVEGSCTEQCREMLYLSRQVVTGLGKDANRIQRAVMLAADVPDDLKEHLKNDHPDVEVVTGRNAVAPVPGSDGPMLLLMDPNHNILMYYTLDKAGKPMLRDLKHLLRISNIG